MSRFQFSILVAVAGLLINTMPTSGCFGCGYEMPMMGGCCGGMGGWGGGMGMGGMGMGGWGGGFGGMGGGFGGMGGWGGGMGCCGMVPLDFRLRGRLFWQEGCGCCGGWPPPERPGPPDSGCRDRNPPERPRETGRCCCCPTTNIRINCGSAGAGGGCQQRRPINHQVIGCGASPRPQPQQLQQPCQNSNQNPSQNFNNDKPRPIVQNTQNKYIDPNNLPPNFMDLLRTAVANAMPNKNSG
uniref:Uncharacterized protein n=1 Tax=Panagrellus redivivus TaxID=6233 RepID=A0A7E4ZWI8_PANRE